MSLNLYQIVDKLLRMVWCILVGIKLVLVWGVRTSLTQVMIGRKDTPALLHKSVL